MSIVLLVVNCLGGEDEVESRVAAAQTVREGGPRSRNEGGNYCAAAFRKVPSEVWDGHALNDLGIVVLKGDRLHSGPGLSIKLFLLLI